jgi:hypothetical protein
LDISQKLARLKDTPSQQNHAAVYAKIFFNWAISEGCLETNPLQHYKQGKKVRRKRILTDDELRTVWSAAGEIGGTFGVLVQLIMLTGRRRGEIAGYQVWQSRSAKLCEAILQPQEPIYATLRQHLVRIDDDRLRRAFAAAINFDQLKEASASKLVKPTDDLWKGLSSRGNHVL